MSQSAQPFRVSTFFAWVVAAVPPLAVAGLIARLAVNVPFQDDWDTASVLVNWHEGELRAADFWEQHSEHRIAVVRLLVWLAGLVTDFNVIAYMILGFVFMAAALALARSLLKICLDDHVPELVPLLTAVASLLLFSLTLQENWLFATAALELALYPATLLVIWALARWPDQWGGLVLAVIGALIGMLTEASGLALWVTGALAIWLLGDASRRRAGRLLVWGASGAIAIGVYMWGLHWTRSAMAGSVAAPVRFLTFAAASIGLPLSYGSSVAWSAALCLAGCVVLIGSIAYIARERPAATRSNRPFVLLAGHGILIAAMISIGRSGAEPASAMTSHYAVAGLFFWMGVLVTATVAVRTMWEESATTARTAIAIATGGAALLLVWSYGTASVASYREAYQRSRNLEMALASLYTEQRLPRDVSQFLYPPDDGRIERQRAELRTLGIGPFAPGMLAGKAALVERFAGQLPTDLSEGFHEGGDCTRTIGWIWDRTRPDVPLQVDIWYRGSRIGTTTANWFRSDLADTGIGNGQHGFVFALPAIAAGTGQEITVTLAGTVTPIGGSPRVVSCR